MQVFKYFQDKAYVINQLPLFSELEEEEKSLIAQSCQFEEYKKFEIIYSELSPPNKFYLVITGRVEIFTSLGKEREESLEFIRRSQFFGIISLLTGEPHSVSARASNDSVILTLDKDNFDYIIKKIPRLSIYFGQYLSRRLKRKDLHSKIIFESTIISVYSNTHSTGKTLYAINLALSIKKESGKKIILLDMNPRGNHINALGKILPKPISLKESFIDDKIIKENRVSSDLGIDILRLEHPDIKSDEVFKIGALLGLLTNEYHYVIIDLPQQFDEIIFKTLVQSDLVHIITMANESNLHKMNLLLEELKKELKSKSKNIKIIVNEYGFEDLIPHKKRIEILKHDIYATLSNIEMHFSLDKEKIVLAYPESVYAKAIRRIARDISRVLVGLALGCGGAMGLSHIGVLKVFEREKIPIDIISGTSIGSMIAAFWAAGYSASDIEKIFIKHCGKFSLFGLMDLTFPKSSFIKGKNIEKFLKKYLGKKSFYDVKLPLKLIACDLINRAEIVLEKGNIVKSVCASIAIPGVLKSVEIDGKILVDGGIINPLPTNVLVQEGVTKLISVNTLPGPVSNKNLRQNKKTPGIFDTVVISIQATEFIIAERSCEDSDITLRPILDDVEWFEFYKIKRLIKKGEEEAEKFLPQIKQLVNE